MSGKRSDRSGRPGPPKTGRPDLSNVSPEIRKYIIALEEYINFNGEPELQRLWKDRGELLRAIDQLRAQIMALGGLG